MSEFTVEYTNALSRDAVRDRLSALHPPLRVIAENVATGTSPIDFVATDPAGNLAIVLIGRTGEDLALLTRGLSHQTWVENQLDTWRQLAPGLDLSPTARVEILLVCPEFSAEICAAVARVESGVELLRARRIRNGQETGLLFETLNTNAAVSAVRPPETPPDTSPSEATGTSFRSGLTEEDLRLTREEREEFN